MSAANAGWPAGLLLTVAGVWLLLQTLVGGLVGRILKLGSTSSGSSSSSSSPDIGGGGPPTGGSGGKTLQTPPTAAQRQQILNQLATGDPNNFSQANLPAGTV